MQSSIAGRAKPQRSAATVRFEDDHSVSWVGNSSVSSSSTCSLQEEWPRPALRQKTLPPTVQAFAGTRPADDHATPQRGGISEVGLNLKEILRRTDAEAAAALGWRSKAGQTATSSSKPVETLPLGGASWFDQAVDIGSARRAVEAAQVTQAEAISAILGLVAAERSVRDAAMSALDNSLAAQREEMSRLNGLLDDCRRALTETQALVSDKVERRLRSLENRPPTSSAAATRGESEHSSEPMFEDMRSQLTEQLQVFRQQHEESLALITQRCETMSTTLEEMQAGANAQAVGLHALETRVAQLAQDVPEELSKGRAELDAKLSNDTCQSELSEIRSPALEPVAHVPQGMLKSTQVFIRTPVSWQERTMPAATVAPVRAVSPSPGMPLPKAFAPPPPLARLPAWPGLQVAAGPPAVVADHRALLHCRSLG
eukprot:TRINITY_DN93678_c0_g1_i1.p1 TRINITY_DN93678_c0_g1~~TRINITY_DN93678_c0_g1_i1.p1  ORF type:complete len:429 (+),score=61.59 TRINITY_DN93678_c0_g1_i1:92-1378(+)